MSQGTVFTILINVVRVGIVVRTTRPPVHCIR
jgi:hypothetical protein